MKCLKERGADFGYDVAKMVIFENRSGMYFKVHEHRIGGNYHLQTARAEILRNLVDGEKDSTVMERRSRHDKAVPDCVLETQAFPDVENNAE